MTFDSADQLRSRLAEVGRIEGHRLVLEDAAKLRGDLIDDLIFGAVFEADEELRDACRWAIWAASQELGCGSASIYELYRARGRGEFPARQFTMPALNLRATAYLSAQQAFTAALQRDAGTVIFEIAKSEMAYTDQRPAEYTAAVLAAAIKTGWPGPVFLQGDHFQFNLAKWNANHEAELEALRSLTREAVSGGFLNIDIDSSTLVDLSRPTAPDQQHVNAENTAELTRLIRQLEPDGVTISIGGEIGEVGKENSTEEELRAYLDAYRYALGTDAGGLAGIAKVSIQTGTSHGGVPLPDGTIASVKIDFDTLQRLSTVARDEYGLAGCVQHGASTLPDEAFHHFPSAGAAEIHLATGFQNIMFDQAGLPPELHREMMAWVETNCADERAPDQTQEQFVYKSRKKAIGAFKRELWTLPDAAASQIADNLRAKFGQLFDELGIRDTRALVERFVSPPRLDQPLPSALGGEARQAVSAAASVFEPDPSGE